MDREGGLVFSTVQGNEVVFINSCQSVFFRRKRNALFRVQPVDQAGWDCDICLSGVISFCDLVIAVPFHVKPADTRIDTHGNVVRDQDDRLFAQFFLV